MSFYAHAIIEVDGQKYHRGDSVPEDVPGFDELVEGGAVSENEYDAKVDVVPPPASVEIEGVVYKRVSDESDSDAEVNV